MVLVLNPFSNDDVSFHQAIEEFSIQKLSLRGIVKAFAKAIHLGTARRNVSSLHSNTKQALAQLFGNKCLAIITSDVLWDAVGDHDVRQLFNELD